MIGKHRGSILVLCMSVLVLASCGGSKGPAATTTATPTPTATGQPSASPSAPSAPPAPAGVARCDLPGLTIAFKGQQGASGGMRGDTFVMTNTGQTACWLYGYAGMQMMGPSGQAMPTNVVRDGPNVSAVNPGPSLVTLQPGASASLLAGWRAWFDGGTTCAVASQLEITPPDAYDHVTIPVTWGLAPCNGGEIDVTAVAPGLVS